MRNKLQTILIGIGLLWGPILANSSTINTINVGSSANDGTGDTLRAAFQKVNSNDAALNADKVENSNGSASGLTLSGTTTIGGTLDVSSATTLTGLDSPDEIAETITNGQPSLWFDGIADYVSVADNAALSFTDGTDDLPFSVGGWFKFDDATNFYAISKHHSSYEYALLTNSTDDLRLRLATDGSNYWDIDTDSQLTDYEGKWVHLMAVYAGAGPNSGNAFSSAGDGVTLYVNGEALAATSSQTGTYAGMSDTTDLMLIGRYNGVYSDGESRAVQVFQSALSASDVETIYRSGVPFALDQASAGATYESDFTSDSVDGVIVNSNVNLDPTLTISSDSDNLAIVDDGSTGLKIAYRSGTHTPGKDVYVSLDYYIPSGNTAVDRLRVGNGTNSASFSIDGTTLDAWTRLSGKIDGRSTSASIYFNLLDGDSVSFAGTSGDKVYIRNVVVKDAGCILDLEIGSTNGTTVPDRSGNGFNGTLNSMTVAGNLVGLPSTLASYSPNPSSGQALLALANGGSGADFSIDEDWSGTWTPSLTFGGASTGITYTTQSGYYSKVGNVCICVFRIALSSKGSASGSTLLEGLPFSAKGIGYRGQAGSLAYYSGMSGLTGVPITAVNTGVTNANLSQFGAASIQDVTNSEFTNTSDIRGTIIYLTD